MDAAVKNGVGTTFETTKNVVNGVVELPMKGTRMAVDVTKNAVEGGQGVIEEVTHTTTGGIGSVFDWLGSFCGFCN